MMRCVLPNDCARLTSRMQIPSMASLRIIIFTSFSILKAFVSDACARNSTGVRVYGSSLWIGDGSEDTVAVCESLC